MTRPHNRQVIGVAVVEVQRTPTLGPPLVWAFSTQGRETGSAECDPGVCVPSVRLIRVEELIVRLTDLQVQCR